MAFDKRTWKGRQGTGLNKFSIDGATPVTVVNQPDSLTEAGDALSAGNLNDFEGRIAEAFDDVETEMQNLADKETVTALSHRVTNLEAKAGDYTTTEYRGDRDVPTGKAPYAVVEAIVGKSRAWNQLASTPYASGTATGISYTFADGVLTLNGTASENGYLVVNSFTAITIPQGHQMLLYAEGQAGSSTPRYEYAFRNANNTIFSDRVIYASEILTLSDAVTSIYVAYRWYSGQVFSNTKVVAPFLRDLTLIFPEGVPATVAECVAKCPDLLKYDAYGTSIVDTIVEGVKSVGVNIWDETLEVGSIGQSDGQDAINNNYRRTTGYTKVLPSQTYYLKCSSAYGAYPWVFFYDADKNYLGYTSSSGSSAFTVPINCFYIRFRISTTVEYQNDIQICLDSLPTSIKTTYHPYMESTLTFPSPISLKSAGAVAEEYYPETGRVTHPIGQVDLGTLTWNILDSTNQTYAVLFNLAVAGTNSLCVKYINIGIQDYTLQIDKTIQIRSGRIIIRDTAYTDAVTFKASLSGIILYYELAEESVTLLDPILDPTILTEGGGTIETIQTQTPVIDNCMDVGYMTL